MSKQEILIIDDEQQIRKLLEINLENQGYKVMHADTGKQGILLCANHNPDLVLLDIGLPDINGQEVLKNLRNWFVNPIIVLSVQKDEESIVEALDHGANDYLTKPFRVGELLARVRASIKRNGNKQVSSVLKFGNVEIDFAARAVKKQDTLIKLTSIEYNLLALLAQHAGRVLTHQFILKEVWGVGYQTQTQYLRVFVASLRKKIEDQPNQPQHIITESGIGYRFVE